MPYSLIPDRYLSILFNAVACYRLGFAVYKANLFIAYHISSLVAFARIAMLPTTM